MKEKQQIDLIKDLEELKESMFFSILDIQYKYGGPIVGFTDREKEYNTEKLLMKFKQRIMEETIKGRLRDKLSPSETYYHTSSNIFRMLDEVFHNKNKP